MVRFKEELEDLAFQAGKCFNSKMVRFKEPLVDQLIAKLRGFNSKMVRFKVCIAEYSDSLAAFQFQNGTI